MKKILLALAVLLSGMASAEEIVLDLSNPNEPLEYDENGVWTNAYNDVSIVYSQEFMFSHSCPYENYFNGFVASKVTAISASGNYDDQFGCMAKGGYAGEGTPYLVAYWDSYSDAPDSRVCEVYSSSSYYTLGFYVCNSPYAYYAIQNGNGYANKFEQGDWFKLIAHGADEFGEEVGSVEYYLADYRSENPDEWKLNDSWEWVDLRSLGKVLSVYFTMESSDTGDYGINTPVYFCLDKYTVSDEKPSSVEEATAAAVKVYYNRAEGAVRVESAEPVMAAVYNMNGALVMQQLVEGTASLDMTACPAGVYVVRCGQQSVKIVK